MVFENDPFEDFKRKRQVRELESTFRKDAEKRHAHLEDLVRSTQDRSELADRIENEMEEFFSDSQAQVSRIIRDYDHPDQGMIDEMVQEEMADFFRESKEAASEILNTLEESDDDIDDAANRMVDHLKNVFEQSMEHIADVRERFGATAETTEPGASGAEPDASPTTRPLSEVVQQLNESPEGHDAFRPDARPAPGPADPSGPNLPPVDLSVLDDVLSDPVPAPGASAAPVEPPPEAPAPPAPDARAPEPEAEPPRKEFLEPKLKAPAPEPTAPAAAPAPEPETAAGDPTNAPRPPKVDRGALRQAPPRVEEQGAEPAAGAPQRILRRQAHLPANKSRKATMSAQEIEELRALKQILLDKGIVTREELDARLGRKTGSAESPA